MKATSKTWYSQIFMFQYVDKDELNIFRSTSLFVGQLTKILKHEMERTKNSSVRCLWPLGLCAPCTS